MDKPEITLIPTRIHPHVSVNEIKEFEAALLDEGAAGTVAGLPATPLLKLATRLVHHFAPVAKIGLDLLRPDPRNYLCVGYLSPHHLSYKSFPYFFRKKAGLRMIWMYDAWPDQWPSIENVFRKLSINIAFLSSWAATQHFQGRNLENFEARWIPEAVTVSNYLSKPSREREIDVLQLGRRWEAYHQKIEGYCRDNGFRYFFEREKGKLIFPDTAGFLKGLASAKISVCVPRTVTHPETAGGVATMTWRYLQSMASKCLILGTAPDEMKEQFGYDPVVPVDLGNPGRQLSEILSGFGAYTDLIERNYAAVRQEHQWRNRLKEMQRAIHRFARERQ